MTAFLKGSGRQVPDLTKLYSLGKSYEGRDLWILEMTNEKKGKPGGKARPLYQRKHRLE